MKSSDKIFLKKKKKKFEIDIKTMGVNIDKNEYYEIVKSNSAHPEAGLQKRLQSNILTPQPEPVP